MIPLVAIALLLVACGVAIGYQLLAYRRRKKSFTYTPKEVRYNRSTWKKSFLLVLVPIVAVLFMGVAFLVPPGTLNHTATTLSSNDQALIADHPAIGTALQLHDFLLANPNIQWSDMLPNNQVAELGWGPVVIIPQDGVNASQYIYVLLGNWQQPNEYVIHVVQSPTEVSLTDLAKAA